MLGTYFWGQALHWTPLHRAPSASGVGFFQDGSGFAISVYSPHMDLLISSPSLHPSLLSWIFCRHTDLDTWSRGVSVCLGCCNKKDHRLDGLWAINLYFSQFLRPVSPSLRHLRSGVWWESASSYMAAPLPPTYCKGAAGSLGVPFIRALFPVLRAVPSWPNHFPEDPPPDPSHWELGFQHTRFRVGHTHSLSL